MLPTTLIAAEPDDKPAYARVEIQQATIGEVAIRRAAAKLIDLPSAKCDGAPFSCSAPVFYGQIYVLTFTEEERSRRGDAAMEPDRRDRGALMIATNLASDASGFSPKHLHMARSAFDAIGAGGLLDVREAVPEP